MGVTLVGAVVRSWSNTGPLAWLLLPVAALYGALGAVRRAVYRWKWIPSRSVEACVIVVGNVVAGGAGKTPTVISLVRHLRDQGHRVGVVSRGFGRRNQDCQAVDAASSVQDVGDEPLLIQSVTGVPVFVGRDRWQAARALLARHAEVEIIVCDDGLQHYGLRRDLEICVFDDRGCGNGWLLPAGPLREPWPRRGVEAAGQSEKRLLVLKTSGAASAGQYSARRRLSRLAKDCHGATVPLTELNAPGRRPVLALAGIARPEAFFTMLGESGVVLTKRQALPDHYDFRPADAAPWSAYQLICTEKDAAKLWPVVPHALAVALEQTMEPAFFSAVMQHIAVWRSRTNVDGLSSPHGH
jgi:tetraacyldisaccharide 4'-kinase